MNSPFLMRCGNIRPTWISDVICGMKLHFSHRGSSYSLEAQTDGAPPRTPAHDCSLAFPRFHIWLGSVTTLRFHAGWGFFYIPVILCKERLGRNSQILFREWFGLHLCPILLLMIHLCAKHNPAMGMIMIPSKIRCDLVMGRAFAMRCESGFGAESRPLGMIAPRSAATALK